MVRSGFGFVEGGRSTGEESPTVVAAQHAGERAEAVGLEFIENHASFGDSYEALVENIGDPDSAFRIKTNAVWHDLSHLQNLCHIRCCWKLAEGCPGAALR